MKEYTENGMLYTWELAGPNGASFILYPDQRHTKEDIDKAKALLRHNQDVVSLSIADDNDRDELFKADYFRDQRTRQLKWWQIEQDDKLIRKERKKGTTPTEFVTNFVLPFIKETEAKMLADHGKKMGNYIVI